VSTDERVVTSSPDLEEVRSLFRGLYVRPGRPAAGRGLHMSEGEPGADSAYRLISTACVVTQYFASMLDFSHCGRVEGSFR
jgi:hypothetical protein